MTIHVRTARPGAPFLIMAAALVALGPMSFDFYLPSFPSISADLGVPVLDEAGFRHLLATGELP